MSSESEPAMLTPLLGGTQPRLTAHQAMERLQLWDLSPQDTPAGKRPQVFLNMVCTADGRATLEGRSGPIGNRADKELFHALRTAVDAVMVGAGTVRAERYRRLVRDEARRRLRRERGLAEEPLACIVSANLALSPEIPLLADPGARVVVLTPSPAAELPAEASAVEYVRAAGRDGRLDLLAALAQLHAEWGVRTVLCEGGPHLNGALLQAGVVDELFLSLAPKLGGGAEPQGALRIVAGPELDPPVQLRLQDALESDGCLLLRYCVGDG